jgi:hypothetical protein
MAARSATDFSPPLMGEGEGERGNGLPKIRQTYRIPDRSGNDEALRHSAEQDRAMRRAWNPHSRFDAPDKDEKGTGVFPRKPESGIVISGGETAA